jgi:site-specific DNA recombinase
MPKATATVLDGYVRVSNKNGREGERYISPTEQRRAIEEAAQRFGVELGEVIVEENVSGSKAADKRRLGELLARCERGESRGLIVSNVDRLTRASKLEEAKILDRLSRAGARLIVVNEGIDTEAPGAELTLDIMAALARAQWRRYQANWKGARGRAIERGAFPAETPWGYERDDDGRLVPVPTLIPYVREMFQRRADGATISALAGWLKDELVHAPRGGTHWSHSTIAQVLRNRVYLGEQRHGELVKASAHEAILSEAEFDAAQVAKPMRTPEPKAYSSGALLAGLARCAGCGHTLKIVVGYGGRLRYYCKAAHTSGPCPARCLVRVDELDPWVEEWFLRAIKDNVRVASAVAARERAAETQRAVSEAEAELSAFVKITSALDGAHFQAGYDARLAVFEAAKLEHASALSKAKVYGDVPSGDLLKAWSDLSVQHKRRLLGAFFDEVRVAQGRGAVAERVEFVRDNSIIPA